MSCSSVTKRLTELIDRDIDEPGAEDSGFRFAGAFFVLGHVLSLSANDAGPSRIGIGAGDSRDKGYAAPAAALWAIDFTPASKKGRWQLGFWMSPNSACAAVVQRPLRRMNGVAHAFRREGSYARDVAPARGAAAADVATTAFSPQNRDTRRACPRPDRVRGFCESARPICTPSIVRNPASRFLRIRHRSSRNGICRRHGPCLPSRSRRPSCRRRERLAASRRP